MRFCQKDTDLIVVLHDLLHYSCICSNRSLIMSFVVLRRGRKPGKRLAKGSIEYIRDKSLRKKEQNKTAATRYRQKKKMEVAITLETEAQLQEKHDNLQKSKDDLHRQILMVKQLLREVINAKKASSLPILKGSSTTSTVVRSSIPVSRVVGRNRRK